MVESLFEMQFACEIVKKMMSDRHTAYLPLNAKNSGVSVMASCLHMHMK